MFNMAPHGKELSKDLRIRIVALHKDGLGQGSATFNVKRAILAPFPPNKIHVEPQNIWCPNKDNTAYS